MAQCLPRRLKVKPMRILSVSLNSSLKKKKKGKPPVTTKLNIAGDVGLEAD